MKLIENTEVMGFEPAIKGMRNPKNSWQRSDSRWEYDDDGEEFSYNIGPNDLDLMKRLAVGGPVHAKYRRMIVVYADIVAPRYWWAEYDTYKVGTVANSCSTMHKIAAKEFVLDDFSAEHLLVDEIPQSYREIMPMDGLMTVIQLLNESRELYLREKNPERKKEYWWQMIQLLPSSYNQRRTVMLNYEVLAGIYPMRKNHKLDEWHKFCEWIESLPHSELITMRGDHNAK